MYSFRRSRMLAAIVAITVVSTALVACTPRPTDDAFFDTSASTDQSGVKPTPDEPGRLLRYRPSQFTVDPVDHKPVKHVSTYQVMYTSTSAIGKSNVVSGAILIPDKPWVGPGSRPLVTVGVGTRGVGDDCAPSWAMTQGLDYEGGEYIDLLNKGWVVAVSDMVGLGTPGTHTYEVGREQGTALLDIARAAQQLPEAGLDPKGPIGIMGYSQGGTSAGWAAELAATYAPELNVKGTAAGGVPANLVAVAKALDGSPFVGLALLASVGFDAAYPDLDLNDFMNERGVQMLDDSKNVCLVSFDGLAQMVKVAGTRFSHYLKDKTKSPLTDSRWLARFEENRLGKVAPSAPVLQQHALFDEMVAFPQAAELRDEWCADGANVTWKVHIFAEHAIGGFLSVKPAISFLADRFADKPVKGNCPD